MISNEAEPIEDAVDLSFLLEVERIEQRELIEGKRLAAMQLRMKRQNEYDERVSELIQRKRLAAVELRNQRQEIHKSAEMERIGRQKRNYDRRVGYFLDLEAKNKLRLEEAKMLKLTEDMEDVVLLMNEIIFEIEMTEAVESMSLKMDLEDVTNAGGSMTDLINLNETKLRTKSKRQRNDKIEVGRTRMSIRRKITK